MGKPTLPDISTLIQAGIDPKTGLPIKFGSGVDSKLKQDLKIQLRIKDEQDYANRFKWFNTGLDLSSQEIERMLYYKYELAFFYFEPLDKFMLLPFTLNGGLDIYSRYQYITPIPYTYGSPDDTKKVQKLQTNMLADLKLKVIYDVQLPEDYMDEEGNIDTNKAKELLTNSAVIIRDYTPQNVNNAIPRFMLQDSILDVMSECIPYMRTALKNSTGVQGMKVSNEDEYSNVLAANVSLTRAALNGDQNINKIYKSKGQEFQALNSGTATQAQEFLQAMQGLDNYRKSLYGLDNNGLWDKKAYVNDMQSGVSNVGLSLQDSLTQRQHACNILNSIFGLGIWCDLSETVSGIDQNMDGINYDEEDQSGQYDQQPVDPVEVYDYE